MAKYFIAIDPPNNIENDIITKKNPKDLHLTLSYLGDKTPQEIMFIKKDLSSLAKQNKNFILKGMEYSDLDNKYRILQINDNNRLQNLFDNINSTGTTKSISKYKELYPHITVGLAPVGSHTELWNPVEIPVNKISLYSVNPGKKNRYEKEYTVKLKKRNLFNKFMDWFSGE